MWCLSKHYCKQDGGFGVIFEVILIILMALWNWNHRFNNIYKVLRKGRCIRYNLNYVNVDDQKLRHAFMGFKIQVSLWV
jgi:hypothetical protein